MPKRSYGTGRAFKRKRRISGKPVTDKFYSIQFRSNGRMITESAKTEDYQEALELLEQRRQEIAEDLPKRSETTFADVMQILADNYRINGKAQGLKRLENTRLPRLLVFFRGKLAHEVTDALLVKYQAYRRGQGAAAASVNRELAAVHRAYVLARKQQVVAVVPTFDRLTESSPRQGFFAKTDLDAIKAHLPSHLRELAEIAYITGWRLHSELLTREWQDVDFQAGTMTLYVGQGKDRNVGRVFPLVPQLREALERQRIYVDGREKVSGRKIKWVFARPNALRVKSIRNAWVKACKVSKVARMVHDFRRTAVRNLELAGVPRPAAMQMVGHKTEEMYRRYTIVDKRMMDHAADLLQKFQEAQ
jgi:integrase